MQNRILLIDDDETFKWIVQKLVISIQPETDILLADNGEEGMQILDLYSAMKKPPQLVLLDIEMNQMDGWEFLETFTKLFRKDILMPNIYLVSSYATDLNLQKAKKYPIVKGLISKPLDTQTMKDILNDSFLNSDN